MLPYEYFTALSAGGGGPEVVRFLWNTQRSRRLLLIAALFDEAERRRDLLAELTPPAEALSILAEAQTRAPAAVNALLLHPQVGAWAAYTMRRAQGAQDGAPHKADFGGLYVLCLIAAAHAGLSWRTRLPHRHGCTMLFGMGMFVSEALDQEDLVEAEAVGGRITLRADGSDVELNLSGNQDTDHWWELRRLRSGASPRIEVILDDLDPLRDLGDPIAPQRLSAADVARWQAMTDDAWALLRHHHADTAEALAAGLVSLAPLPIGDGRETRSASSGESFGAVMMSPPSDAATMAVSLFHEFQHIKLGGLMHLIQLTVEDDTERFYAPWRDDPRPIAGLLQGIYAFFGIAAFWRQHRRTVSGTKARLADFEYAYARGQAHEGIGVAVESGCLTVEGDEFVRGLRAQLEPWLTEQVDVDSLAQARIVADYHRVGWRVRNHEVRLAEVDSLARMWRDGAPAAIASERPAVAPAAAVRWSLGMVGLVRRRIFDPTGWSNFAEDDEWGGLELRDRFHPGAISLVGGDPTSARRLYAQSLRNDYKDCDSWTGFALALDATGAEPAARALRKRPELVQAVYVALAEHGAEIDPAQLAYWLGAAIEPCTP